MNYELFCPYLQRPPSGGYYCLICFENITPFIQLSNDFSMLSSFQDSSFFQESILSALEYSVLFPPNYHSLVNPLRQGYFNVNDKGESVHDYSLRVLKNFFNSSRFCCMFE
jgi:hypothetical protein